MKNFKGKIATGARNVVIAGFVGAASVAPAFATTAEDISAAVTEGTTNYSTAVSGVIALAAVGFGIGLIVRALSR